VFTDDLIFDALVSSAYLGGAIIRNAFGTNNQQKNIQKSSSADIVTETDLLVESRVKSLLAELCPDVEIVSEEDRIQKKISNEKVIYLDPVDGTLNFSHGFPEVSISLGYWIGNEPVIGVVYNPIRDEFYSGRKGYGAYKNGKPINVSTRKQVVDSLLLTGWPYDKSVSVEIGALMGSVVSKCQEVRLMGSAALAVCKVAEGIVDGYWENGLYPWDLAGAVSVLIEAGGRYSSFSGDAFDIYSGEIIATNGIIHNEVMDYIN